MINSPLLPFKYWCKEIFHAMGEGVGLYSLGHREFYTLNQYLASLKNCTMFGPALRNITVDEYTDRHHIDLFAIDRYVNMFIIEIHIILTVITNQL